MRTHPLHKFDVWVKIAVVTLLLVVVRNGCVATKTELERMRMESAVKLPPGSVPLYGVRNPDGTPFLMPRVRDMEYFVEPMVDGTFQIKTPPANPPYPQWKGRYDFQQELIARKKELGLL